jgi:nucleotide-binding universal stress UspA family protein
MKIISTVDFSTASETILRFTKTYAEKMGAEVFLIYAEPETTDITSDEYDATPESVCLKKNTKALEKVGIKITPLSLQGPACEKIMDEAIKLKADLIIIGAHRHSRASCKIPMGHTRECVLLKSKIPVLGIPA